MGSQRFPLSVSAAQALTRFVTVFSLKKKPGTAESLCLLLIYFTPSPSKMQVLFKIFS